MAEGYEPYHVPQQSRRDRLRVVATAQPSLHGGAEPTLPYDHHNHLMISGSSSSSSPSSSFSPPSDLMMTCTNLRSTPYGFDPQFLYGAPSQIMLTGTTWSNNNNNNHGLFHKPEPLTLSLSSYNNNNENNYNNNIIGNDGVSRSAVPLGPFVGYATVLKGSRFMRPAQQLMEELCCEVIGWDILENRVSAEKIVPDSSLLMMDTNAIVDDDHDHGDYENHDYDDDYDGVRKKKSKLISMLDEIYRKYKQYYQQMQAVVSSFEYVSGLGNAAPYANLAVKAMSRHFGCLKIAIMDQLQFGSNSNNKLLENSNHINNGQIIRPIIRGPGLVQHQPVWRPQRGLPERAVAVLRAWLFEHFLHPYPTDTDKLMLAKQTGLSRNQVSNWFINARVRLWKPMVEEIHTLETSQSQKATSTSRAPDDAFVGPTTTSKRSRIIIESPPNNNNNNVMSNLGSENDTNVSLAYGGLASHLEAGPGRGGAHGGSVSLTLGLHRDNNNNNNNNNNNFCLTEPTTAYSLNRFGTTLGLEGSDVMSSSFIGGQNRHFGGQLLHDFVG